MSTESSTLDKMFITPAQCRAGRALVEMDQNTLAASASVSRGVVIDFEKGKRTPGANNLAAIQRVLEAAGVEFIDGGQPGVRLSATTPTYTGGSIDASEPDAERRPSQGSGKKGSSIQE